MILLATGNKHKVREIQAILGPLPLRTAPPEWNYEEGLESLEANAKGKALSAKTFAKPGEIVLAEDTGLFVEALGGEPGVASARYAGEIVTFDQNIEKLLKNLKGVPQEKRRAYFMTVACAILADGTVKTVSGRVDGLIVEDRRGKEGFGYDPVFFIPEAGKTMAEMNEEEKNKISHRSRALKALLPYLSL